MSFNKKITFAFVLLAIFIFASSNVLAGCGCSNISQSIRLPSNTLRDFQDIEKKPVSTDSEKREFYNKVFNIKSDTKAKISTVDSIIRRGKEDPENFFAIMTITRDMVEEDYRSDVAEILIDMNNTFVKKFYLKAMESEKQKYEIKEQIINYVKLVSSEQETEISLGPETEKNQTTPGENKIEIKRDISEESIKSLFNNEISRKEFINIIFNK